MLSSWLSSKDKQGDMSLVCLRLSVSLATQAIIKLDYQLPSYMYGISIPIQGL